MFVQIFYCVRAVSPYFIINDVEWQIGSVNLRAEAGRSQKIMQLAQIRNPQTYQKQPQLGIAACLILKNVFGTQKTK